MINNLFKIFVLIGLFIVCGYHLTITNKTETFTDVVSSVKVITNAPNNKIDELARKIVKKSKSNPQIKSIINSKFINWYQHILTNPELKFYLKFNNLIDDNGMLLFINESDDVVLENQIKIILLTVRGDNLNNIFNYFNQ
jgi:hypothetical protein